MIRRSRKLRSAVSGLAKRIGVRLVNAEWGPRGFADAFRRAREDGLEIRSVIDVGASTGVWTRECMKVFPAARYLLVDPLDRNQPALAALAKEHATVESWKGVLGGTAGEVSFYDHADQSSLFSSQVWPGECIAVPMRRLDDLLQERALEPPYAIKIDVQGAELAVLEGAEEALAKTALLMVEVSFLELYHDAPLAHDVIAWLGKRGFHIYELASYAQRPLDNRLAQSDMIFVPRNSPLIAAKGWG